jgi:sugar transferase (PEP-CTERM/EpsH1 system associated)
VELLEVPLVFLDYGDLVDERSRARPARPEVLVAHVVHSFGVGGLENGVVNLVNDSTRGMRHVIVCMTGDRSFQRRLRPGVGVLTIGKRPGHDVGALVRLIRCLRRMRPQIVHSRNWGAIDAVVAARLARVPTVLHGEHGREISDPDGHNVRRNRVRRLLAPFVTRFITVSDDLRRWLVQEVGVPAGKVVTICNGVDTERFSPRDRIGARAAVGLPLERSLIGTVGRLDPVKDQVGLVRAFVRVRTQKERAVLVITGDGPCRGELAELITELGLGDRALLLRERNDIPTVLAALDLFVLPSIAEGISNTLLEAMATGLPIVATRVGGNPELVEDGASGTLVPRRDVQALASGMARYLNDEGLRRLHGQEARRRAVEHFSLDRMRAGYARLYSDLVRGAGRQAA